MDALPGWTALAAGMPHPSALQRVLLPGSFPATRREGLWLPKPCLWDQGGGGRPAKGLLVLQGQV